MKKQFTKFKRLDEIENNIATQASSSSMMSNLKKNKKSFHQTRSTNFSVEQLNKNQMKASNTYKNIIKNNQTPPTRSPKRLLLKKDNSNKTSVINITINQDNDKGKDKDKESPKQLNSLYPTNINSFLHLVSGNDFGIFENLNWALGLRDYKDKKIRIPESLNEPSFYREDLEKFKNKQKKKFEPLISELNPNYNKIKHLTYGNKCHNGGIDFSQFKFSTCLRNYKNEDNKANKEKEKSWKYLPLPAINSNKYKSIFMAPITNQGKENFKNLEKIIPKNYEINYGEAIVGNDKIKTKILVNNRNYSVSGYGEYLGDKKYDNIFEDNNMFANKKILSTATNQQCTFELGLRSYGNKNRKKQQKIKLRKNSN
jgi:hypothetical protein